MADYCTRCGRQGHRADKCPWPLRLALVQGRSVGVYDVRPRPCIPKQVAVYHAGSDDEVTPENIEACRTYREPI